MFNYCTVPTLKDIKAETFPDGRYYVMEDGSRLPSITTVLGALSKADILAWRKRVGYEEANKISKKASIASIAVVPVLVAAFVISGTQAWEIFSLVGIGALIEIRHASNIKRLLSGTEPPVTGSTV